MSVKKIGFLGLTFTDPNKGCEALTYTFLDMLREFYPGQRLEIICFMRGDDLGIIPEVYPEFDFRCHVLNIYNPFSWLSVYKEIKTCACVFDASYGDGFTGIYGTRRNFVQCLRKQMVLSAKKPLYLLPQTYGNYKFPFKKWSVNLIKKATLAYARDEQTAKSVGPFVKTTSDMAFGLPFDKSLYKFDEGKKIGINVSSLLWDTKTVGRFGLTVDYRRFYRELISYLIEKNEYQIHLIPHVIDQKNPMADENDYRICEELEKEFHGRVVLAPAFNSAIEAKSYISNMDIFLGSRMHSTIGAISSGVATIPFSYAYKFESLYSNINYPYVINATKESTEDALEKAKTWIGTPDRLLESSGKSVALAKEKLEDFRKDLHESLIATGLI
ncbi:MAG: polysaccharide pyruvyl transferase family protein [Clostridia bacterium]|nr:polysaccharide pyruvyl transferase family protein [Clostridia bacterium]